MSDNNARDFFKKQFFSPDSLNVLKDGRFFWLEWLTPSSFTSAHFVEDSPAPVSDDYCPVLRYDQGDGKFHADYRLCDTDKAAAVCYLYPDSVGGSSPGQGGGGCGAAAEAEGEGSSPPLVDRLEYFIKLCLDWRLSYAYFFRRVINDEPAKVKERSKFMSAEKKRYRGLFQALDMSKYE